MYYCAKADFVKQQKTLSIWHQTTIEIFFLYNVSKIWDKSLVFLTERSSKVNCAWYFFLA